MKSLLRQLKTPLFFAGLISIGVNLLMLVPPVFMMQVFDRVLMSGHLETLYGLTALAIGALVILGILDSLRQQVLARAGDWLERHAGRRLIDAVLVHSMPITLAFRHVAAVRGFYCAQGVFALLDAPWIVVFAGILWWINPWLGAVAISGAITLMAIAILTELTSRKPLLEASKQTQKTQDILSSALRNRDAIRAMGMATHLSTQWQEVSEIAHDQNKSAAERSAYFSGATKALRLIFQTLILAVGAVLVLSQELSPGGMIAASILMGRCLAPAEQAIGAWKTFVRAREAWSELLRLPEIDIVEQSMKLPSPTGSVTVTEVTFQPDTERRPVLDQVSLSVGPRQVMCVVGPSGSGKTTLCRMLVGALKPTSGTVTLDERPVTGWNPDQLGTYVGYLPQRIELLPGTLKQNIARFGEIDPEAVVAAAQTAGVDRMIRQLPDGYETKIGPEASPMLSAGQMQMVGLARALYGKPTLIVLDEPNAHLDVDGEKALAKAIRRAALWSARVLVVSHRQSLLKAADRIAVLQNGRLILEGSKDEILNTGAQARKAAQTSRRRTTVNG